MDQTKSLLGIVLSCCRQHAGHVALDTVLNMGCMVELARLASKGPSSGDFWPTQLTHGTAVAFSKDSLVRLALTCLKITVSTLLRTVQQMSPTEGSLRRTTINCNYADDADDDDDDYDDDDDADDDYDA
eukprot:4214761-Amphidinium_carterae.5